HGRLILRDRPDETSRAYLWMSAAVVMFTPFAVFSKENGALLPVLILAVQICLPPPPYGPARPYRRWIWMFLIFPTAAIAAYALWSVGDPVGSFAQRDFTLSDRLWSETRILASYLRHLVIPGIESGGLYQDNFTISRGLLEPPSTLFASAFLLALMLGAWRLRRRWPV